jgi:hypothetical protein
MWVTDSYSEKTVCLERLRIKFVFVFGERKFLGTAQRIFIGKYKMCRTKKTWLIGLLAVGTLFVGTASATCHLPDSSYDDHFWRGRSTCEERGFDVLTDFAICDVEKTPFSYKVTMFKRSTIARRCIDAYQMFNPPKNAFEERKHFSDILIIDGQRNGCILLKGEADCCGDWSCREVLIPQGRYSQRGPEKTLNRTCLGGDRYLQFLVLR